MTQVYHALQLALFPAFEHTAPECDCEGKRCTQCEVTQCIGQFHLYVRSKDGYRSVCKSCRKAERETEEFKEKRRAYHKEHADQINTKKREWSQANAEKVYQHGKRYRENNPEKVQAYMQQYNQSERGKERERRYREQNPEKVRATQRKSWQKHHDQRIAGLRVSHARARTTKTGAGGAFTVEEWETLKAQYNYTCPACGRQEPEISLSVDHVVPVTKFGPSDIANIQPLCLSCNARKGTKIIDYREKEKDCG